MIKNFVNKILSLIIGTTKTVGPDHAIGGDRDASSHDFGIMGDIRVINILGKIAVVTITDVQGKILFVNDKFCEVSGYRPEEVIGKDHRILNSGTHTKEFFKQMWEKILSGQSWTGEICNKKKNGDNYWLETVISPYQIDGNTKKPTQFISIRYEITDKKTAEVKLVRASKMASLGEMASGIAHEVNNPLAVIKGKASQLIRYSEMNQLNPELLKDHLTKIITTTDRITNIIKGIRNFSRDAASDPMETMQLRSIVDDTLEFCVDRFRGSETKLIISDFPELNVFGIRTKLSQVLLNLLNNAYDAVQGNPDKWVRLEARINHNHVIEIAVVDSGTGIPDHVVEKLMEPFFTTKGAGKGTGLGLSISKVIVNEHGGRMYYDKKSQNTRFVIELPQTNISEKKKAA